MRLSLFAALSSVLPSTLAVFADEAYDIDYHYALLGQPKEDTTFFHQPNPASKASLVYTLSERGVLGAINPRDGSVVWRQLLAQNVGSGNASFLRAGEGQDAVVGGVGSTVSAWSAADGRLVWDHMLGGQIEDVEVLELADGKEKSVKDALVLGSGDAPVVQRLDGETGSVKWQYQLDGTDTPYQVSASTTEVFAILLHKTMLGYYKIRVISLDPVTGRKTDEYTLSSESELASPETIISVGANSASPIIAWTDAAYSALKVNIVGTKTITSFNIDKPDGHSVERVRLHAPYHTNSMPHFLVHYETASSHWAEVYHVDLKKNKVNQAYSLPKVAGKGVFSTSTSSDANVYFTRITDSEVMTVSSASHGVLGRWPLATFGVAGGPGEDVQPVSAVSEVSIKGEIVSAIRSAVLLSTGDWVMLRDGKAAWQRPEALASTVSATFTTPSAVEEFVRELELEAHSNFISAYVHRLTRHLSELQRLPAFLASIPNNVVRSFLGTSADGGMGGDPFGYHKVIACATESGRVIGLDAGDASKILWSRSVSLIKDGAGVLISQPELESCPGIFEVWDETIGRGVSVSLNATSGEVLSKGCPPASAVRSGADVQYTLEDGALSAKQTDKTGSTSTWHFAPSPNEHILSLVPRPVNNPVASIGKVLGDRRVLYKYLDANLALLVTANDAASTATFYVLNTVSGAILYSATHNHLDLSFPVASIISENWFAYALTTLPTDNNPKGHQLVVGEMFESLVPNDRGPLASEANFSSFQSTAEPYTLTHTYQIPEPISQLTVSSTSQGITSRHLLALLPASNALIGLPYAILDPRRPIGRDPTKDEQGEGLVRYSPTIEFNPQWYLSHSRELMGVKDVVTEPAVVESTSLVFGFGLDVFGTRVTPSGGFDVLGKGFNKFQMLATVAGLFVATTVVGPLVTRKQVNARWQFA